MTRLANKISSLSAACLGGNRRSRFSEVRQRGAQVYATSRKARRANQTQPAWAASARCRRMRVTTPIFSRVFRGRYGRSKAALTCLS